MFRIRRRRPDAPEVAAETPLPAPPEPDQLAELTARVTELERQLAAIQPVVSAHIATHLSGGTGSAASSFT